MVCEKLEVKFHFASDSVRLFKYEHVNLVDEVRKKFNNDNIDDVFVV